MTNLVALLIVTNLVRVHCPYCDTGSGFVYPVMHEHQYERVVTTNYLPVVEMPAKEEIPAWLDPTNWVMPEGYLMWDGRKVVPE